MAPHWQKKKTSDRKLHEKVYFQTSTDLQTFTAKTDLVIFFYKTRKKRRHQQLGLKWHFCRKRWSRNISFYNKPQIFAANILNLSREKRTTKSPNKVCVKKLSVRFKRFNCTLGITFYIAFSKVQKIRPRILEKSSFIFHSQDDF